MRRCSSDDNDDYECIIATTPTSIVEEDVNDFHGGVNQSEPEPLVIYKKRAKSKKQVKEEEEDHHHDDVTEYTKPMLHIIACSN